ncbi:hypothetical protein [Streptomyces sp. BE133]|uniref:hypothetical protein n=1 Tax=Streptomyces sp. BE133 TaxID=3002523 RepID=UPI002E7673B1|nr:hypothetical protein [Streptomyces sp. BE133]
MHRAIGCRGAESFGGERGVDAACDIVGHVLRRRHSAEKLTDLHEGGKDITAEFAAIHMASYVCRM